MVTAPTSAPDPAGVTSVMWACSVLAIAAGAAARRAKAAVAMRALR